MLVLSQTGGIAQTNCYLIADEASKQAVLFDAPDGTVNPLLDQAAERGLELVGLWLTHGHFDHIADHQRVTDRFPGAQVLIHPLDEPKLQNPGRASRMFALPFTIPPRSASGHVTDNQMLRLGTLEVQVLHTPGHAPGHVMYHFPDEQLLIGGDLIIMNAVGRTDLPDSNFDDLQQSIRRVMKLPRETRLLPGHGRPSTLRDELRSNAYVREAVAAGQI